MSLTLSFFTATHVYPYFMSFMYLLHDIYCLVCSQSQPVRVTLFPFEEQVGRVYTSAVFKEYKETYFSSIAFRIRAGTT